MIVPIRCFTCGKPITQHSWEEYIRMTTDLDDTKIREVKATYENTTTRPFGHKADPGPDAVSQECMALNILKIKRMCCRRMYLGTIDIFDKL